MATKDGLSIERGHDNGELVIHLGGEVDLATSPFLEEALSEVADNRVLVLECSAITFLDSSGLRVVLRQATRLSLGGGSLRLRRPSTSVRQLLRVVSAAELDEEWSADFSEE